MTTIRIALFFFMIIATGARADSLPVLIGINAEFGVVGSTSAQAIRLGAQIAVDEINTAGGVLGGRSLALVEKDDRSVPARFIRNLREFAADPHVVAVLIGLLTPNTEWGRSNAKAAEALDQADPQLTLVDTQWYNWGDPSLLDQYQALRKAGAEQVIFVGNEREGAVFIKEIAALPKEQRLPILAAWGITGGDFFEGAGPALREVDLAVVQTYSFIDANDPVAQRVIQAARRYGIDSPRRIPSPVGVAHAYDLVHILARAIQIAGSTDRSAIRDALEQVTNYMGLVKTYPQPFTADQHDALSPQEVFMARYAEDGAIVRIDPQ